MTNPVPTKGGHSNPFDPDLQPIVPGRAVVSRADLAAARRAGFREMLLDEIIESHFSTRTAETERFLDWLLGDIAVLALDGQATKAVTLDAVDRARGDEGDVRPLFEVFPFNHWSAFPGEGKDPAVSGVGRANVLRFAAKRYRDFGHGEPVAAGVPVFVIDTGLLKPRGWEGALPRVRALSDRDYETPPQDALVGVAGHGTFVASVVSQIARSSEVWVLRVDFSKYPDFPQVDGAPEIQWDELALSAAIFRIAEMNLDKAEAVVSMSFGTYGAHRRSPNAVTVLEPLPLESTVRHLLNTAPNITFVAAAGNRLNHSGVYEEAQPAAFDGVVSVGAADQDDDMVVWPGPAKHTGPVPSGLLLAPGVDLVGPAGTPFVKWSGSSFAAAIVSGLSANRAPLPPSPIGRNDVPHVIFDW